MSQLSSATATGVSRYFHRFRLITSLHHRLRVHDPTTPFPLPTKIDAYVASQAIRSAPSPDAALSLFHSLHSHPTFSHTHLTIHALANTLALYRRTAAVQSLLRSIDDGAYPNAVPPTAFHRLRWVAVAGDLQASLREWGRIGRHSCLEAYNLVMGVYVGLGMDSDAVGFLEKMVEDRMVPNARTCVVIVEHLVRNGKLSAALEVFDRLPRMRIRRTSKLYNVLADGLSTAGNFDGLKQLIVEMRSDGLMPGRGTRAAMVRMWAAAGCVEGAEEFAAELLSSNDGDDDEDDCAVGLKPQLDPDALANALGDWETREVEALEEAKLVWTRRLVCKFIRGFKKAETAWKFFCWVSHQPGGFKHDCYTISRMMAVLARNGHDGLVDRLIAKVKLEGILLPFSTVRVVVDSYGLSKKAESSLRVLRDVTSICGPLSNSSWALLCSSLLRTLVKCMRGDIAMEVLEDVMAEGIVLDIQTFSGLMQFFAMKGDSKSVHRLLVMVKRCRLQPDTCMYRVLNQAFVKLSESTLAVFEDMRNSNMVPDAATESMLVMKLLDEGKRREAAYVEQRSEEAPGQPFALIGRAWTASAMDFTWVYNTYRNNILNDGNPIESNCK